MIDKEKLRQMFTTVLGAYKWPEKPGQFIAWETWISNLPEWAVSQIVMEAPDLWPKEMPEVGQFKAAVINVVTKRRNAQRAAANPITQEPMPEYTGDPRILELVQKWEREDATPGAKTTSGIERARAINAVWAATSRITGGDGGPVAIPGRNPRGTDRRKPDWED